MSGMLVAAVVFAVLSGICVARYAMQGREERRRRDAIRAEMGLASAEERVLGDTGPIGRLRARRERERLSLEVERHVPEMLDAVALGMRSGLSFESALKLYASRFDDELALSCRRACQEWESGLVERDDALKAMADRYDVASLSRFVSNVVRALRFGSPMGRMLKALSDEARSCYRARMEERVAKAPVKMLAPTAGLILPAMLILMMGPVALELVG